MANKIYSQTEFSFFGRGHYSKHSGKWVPSTTPQQTVDVAWIGNYILSERAKYQTEELRRIMATASDQELREYKVREFDAVTGAGIFSYGKADKLTIRSNYIVMDIDDLASIDEAREVQRTLVIDKNVETALCFVSPSGNGIKWWLETPDWCGGEDFAEQYAEMSRYIGFNYGLQADLSCSNVNRLCFLPYDPECFVNPKYIIKNE